MMRAISLFCFLLCHRHMQAPAFIKIASVQTCVFCLSNKIESQKDEDANYPWIGLPLLLGLFVCIIQITDGFFSWAVNCIELSDLLCCWACMNQLCFRFGAQQNAVTH